MPAIHGSIDNELYRHLLNISEKTGEKPAELVSKYVAERIQMEVKKK